MRNVDAPDTRLLDAVQLFNNKICEIDRSCRRASITVPTQAIKDQAVAALWSLFDVLFQLDSQRLPAHELKRLREACRRHVGPWLFRSRFFNRSYHKPHGYAGDFMMTEWMYDLEADACEDPAQPAIVNCLDYAFRSIHSVQSLWERRRWFQRLLTEKRARTNGPLRVLDVACGGARYIRDFIASQPNTDGIEVTLFDQDAAALAFCRTRSLAPWASQVRTISAPTKNLGRVLATGQFDVVMSAGLFDYLDQSIGSALMTHMVSLTAPGGMVAISNFHPGDGSRIVKEWLGDWELIFRDEAEVAALYPSNVTVRTEVSRNGALAYGHGTAPPAWSKG